MQLGTRNARTVRFAAAALGALLLCAPLPGLCGGRPYLVRDLNPGAPGSAPTSMTAMGGRLYFNANDGGPAATALWTSDGTTAGTSLVADLAPGTASSSPGHFAVAGDTVFFSADDGAHGTELWKSDGSEAGTVLVRDIGSMSFSDELTVVGNRVFFTISDTAHGKELWVSDGSEAGTAIVEDITPGPVSSIPERLTDAGGTLFFTAYAGGYGQELWKSDGTEAGTSLVKDIRPGSNSSSIDALVAVGTSVFLVADDGVSGTELWRSSGTEAGTALVKDIVAGIDGSSIEGLTASGGKVFFTTDDGVIGKEVWVSDGTADGTKPLKDIVPGAGGSSPRALGDVDGTLFFVARATGSSSAALWKSDGSAAGTRQLATLPVWPIDPIVAWNGLAFFACNDTLWRSDGTAAGTFALRDFSTSWGLLSSLAPGHDALYFSADDGVHAGEPWKSDGTVAGTVLVRDIAGGDYHSTPHDFVRLGGATLFAAIDATGDEELYRTDGTPEGTTRVKDVNATPRDQPLGAMTPVGSRLFFCNDDYVHGGELWTSDGTPAGTGFVVDLLPINVSSVPVDFTDVGGTAYFTANSSYYGREVFRSDGTPAGTVLVKDVSSGTWWNSNVKNLTAFGGSLWFSANNVGVDGLWKSDGTPGGTAMLKRVNPTGYCYLQNFRVAGSQLFFTGEDGVNGAELWRTDGTEAGTTMVRDITAGAGSTSFGELAAVGGRLFFTAAGALWVSDGTDAGTASLRTGSATLLTAVGDTLFFAASDAAGGLELWKSDGTAAGTVRVKDIRPGSSSSSPLALTAVGGRLYFTADAGAGRRLWVSDGTDAGTLDLRAPYPGFVVSDVTSLKALGGALFFQAAGAGTGAELWATLPDLVINELDCAQPGADRAEFLEIKNRSGAAVDLGRFSVVFVDLAGGVQEIRRTVQLPAVPLPPGALYVLCADASRTPSCDLEIGPGEDLIPDGGPAAVALFLGDEVVDAVGYGGPVPAPYTEGPAAPEDTGTTGTARTGISRSPDGADTDRNDADFAVRCITPGAANSADAVCPNTAPTASNLDQEISFPEDAASVALADIVVTDPDADEEITATLTLADPGAGALTTSGAAAYDPGTGTWQAAGPVAAVNAALATVAFVPAPDYAASTSVAARVVDSFGAGPSDGTITLAAIPANDPPEATNLTATVAYTEGDASVALPDIVVEDVDAGDAVTATLTLADPAAGALTANGIATYDAGTGVWSATGSPAEVNAALAAVEFAPAPERDTTATVATRVRDLAGAGPADGAITLAVTPVNDPPGATNLTQSHTLAEDAPGADLDDIVVTDVDTGETITATLTLADAAAGSITVGGVATWEAAAGRWSAVGPVAAVNAALAAAVFVPAADRDAGTTVATRVRDAAGTGPAEGTITLEITPVEDAPAALDDAYRAFAGITLVADGALLPGVLANDADAEGATLHAVLEEGPASGTLELFDDGTFTYAPAAGFLGTDSFTYRAGDGGLLSAPALVTITVSSPLLFEETFADGNAAGDKSWATQLGAWSVTTPAKVFTPAVTKRNLSVVKRYLAPAAHRAAGRVEAKVRIATGGAAAPNALLVFSFVDKTHYRYVKLTAGTLTLGQVGVMGGEAAGVKATAAAPVTLGKWARPRLDFHPDGLVEITLGGVVRLSHLFGEAVPGGIGLAATRSRTSFDDYRLWDEAVLP